MPSPQSLPLRERRPRVPLRVTPAAWIAVALTTAYAAGLVVLAVSLGISLTRGEGFAADVRSPIVARGVTNLIVLLVLVAAALVVGAVTVLRGRRGMIVVFPLAMVAIGGSIGEGLGAVSGTDLRSLAIGAGIVVAAAAPAALLLLPRDPAPAKADAASIAKERGQVDAPS